ERNLILSLNVPSLIIFFQNLQAQMRDFETSVEPLQDWLNETEEAVQESSSRLHDLTAKKQELHRLQVQYSVIKTTSIHSH
uniref:Uncharacterized protein n=1 Tax=Sinocyclocheilus rhinocerous TaxID=307959 RepID=A0A673LAE1_9TELE